jgi:microcystin degradation protein MlrC
MVAGREIISTEAAPAPGGHFRADFGSFASRVLVVEAPGPQIADSAKLRVTRLPPRKRLNPGRRT